MGGDYEAKQLAVTSQCAEASALRLPFLPLSRTVREARMFEPSTHQRSQPI